MKHKLTKLISVILIISIAQQGAVWAQPEVAYSLRAVALDERGAGRGIMHFPTYDVLVRLRMPESFPDGWNPILEHVLRVSGPPVAIWGPAVGSDAKVSQKMTQVLEQVGEARGRVQFRAFQEEFARTGEHVSKDQMRGAQDQIRTAAIRVISNALKNVTVQLVKSDPAHSPALFLDPTNQEYIFADYNPDGRVLTMREDAFWDLSPNEITELFYRLAMMYGTANSNSYRGLRDDPADVVNAVVVDLIKTVDKETIPAFQLGSFGCTPLAERAYRLLLPPYYGVTPTSTIAVNTSEASPESMQTILVSNGIMPGVLHVVEPLVQNEQDRESLIAAGCWQTPPFARDVYGRSHLVNLGPGRLLSLSGGSFRNILAVPRFKANVYRDKFGVVHHPRMVRYFGGGAPSVTFAMDRIGRTVQVPHPGQPLGSIVVEGLLQEIGMSRKFWDKDFLVAYPLGYIERNSPRFRFRGEPTGTLLQAMPVNAGRRLLQEFEFIITRMVSFYEINDLRAHEREVQRLGELVENFAGYLRRIHDAGFIHGYPHTNNFSLLDYKTYLFMTHDLDNAREKSGMSLDEAMLFQTNDIGVAFLSLILALGPANVEHYNNFARNRNLPTIQERFFGGYFRDLAGEVDSRYQDHAILRNFLFGEPTQRPISWIDDSLVHVMRRILEPENLRPLAITQAQLQQAPPNPLQRRVNCEVGINELSRLMEGAMLFEIPVLSEESQIGTGHADNVAMIPIPQAVRELAKGDEVTSYVPVVSPGGLYLVYRDSPLYRQIIQQEQQIEAWQQRAEAGAARKQLDDIGAQGPGLSGSDI